jgi:hypothetical protein
LKVDCPNQKKERVVVPPDASEATCFNCQEVGHFGFQCKSAKKETRTCYNCQKEGHLTKDCPKKSKKGRKSAQVKKPASEKTEAAPENTKEAYSKEDLL